MAATSRIEFLSPRQTACIYKPFHPIRTMKSSLVKSRERRAKLTLKDIGQRKRRAAIAASSSSSFSSSSQRGGAHYSSFGQGQRDQGGNGRAGGLVARAVRAVTTIIPGFSPSSGSGGGSSLSSSRQAAAEVCYSPMIFWVLR